MKNIHAVKTEVSKRIAKYIQRGAYVNCSRDFVSSFGNLCKSWISSDGKLWTLRAYLVKYHKDEYERIVRHNHELVNYKGASISDLINDGLNIDFYNYFHGRANKYHTTQSHDGRAPKSLFG